MALAVAGEVTTFPMTNGLGLTIGIISAHISGPKLLSFLVNRTQENKYVDFPEMSVAWGKCTCVFVCFQNRNLEKIEI